MSHADVSRVTIKSVYPIIKCHFSVEHMERVWFLSPHIPETILAWIFLSDINLYFCARTDGQSNKSCEQKKERSVPNPFSAGTDFRRHDLTSKVDPRTGRVIYYNDRRPITQVF